MESGGGQKCLHTIKIGDVSENRRQSKNNRRRRQIMAYMGLKKTGKNGESELYGLDLTF